ncbi:MAG: UvrD-helicase domain-containing protein [Pirellulales bacterium]
MPVSTSLTSEQEVALRTRDTSIALAAGAGCGKTFVLSERFLSHLDHDNELVQKAAELRQLIAITFTDAAAREMRRRIRDKCYERSRKAETKASQDAWLKLLRAIEAARVSTIHAFCASLLREHAVAAGLDPTFGVLEQGAADVLESEVIDDVLRSRLADLEPTTMELAASSGLSKLKDQLRELLKYRHDEHFHKWRTATADELVAAWQECHEQVALPAALADLAASPDVRVITELLLSVTPPPKKEKFVEAKAQLLDMLPRLARSDLDEVELKTLRSHVGVQTICSAKDWPTKEAFEAYRDACKRFRDALDKHTPQPFSPAAAREAAELGLKLLDLAHDVAGEYERAKTRAGKLDFDDLLARAHQLLTDPKHTSLRERLSADLRLLLVDEFQDTDRLQVELVRALCGDVADGKLFFVGDMNQSIYRFRGAQPDVFLDLRGEVPVAGQLPLTKNFRSQPAVLNFVNALFVHALGKEYKPLRPNRSQTTAEPAIEFLWTITPDKKAVGGKQDARSQEARRIARRLRELIESEAPIIADALAHGGKRPLRLGDVAILFRALSDVALYESAFRDYGLDYYLVGGHAFYAQQEIFDVLNLLRAVASPADEISLAGVLRSPFFSLADETLFWLVESAGSLNDGLFGGSLPKELSTEERLKAAAAAETLADLRARKDSLPITTLLQEALARTGYDAALLAEFLGERKLANLNKLIEQARTADSGNVLDLAGFIAQLAEFVAREPKEALAATLSESADVIRLMTIHHAKGLEFPLVIVPDVDRKPDYRAPAAALAGGLGPVVKPPTEDDEEPTTTGITLYRALEKRADAEERKRLFYVATTRAADYLILSSSLAGYDVDELEGDWTKLLAERFDLESGNFHDSLPADYPPPQVRVTNSEPATDFKPLASQHGPDLVTIVEAARDLAVGGGGIVPPDVGPIDPDPTARRQFSVSRLSGKLIRPDSHEFELTPLVEPDAIDPRTFGTFVHAALQRIDLSHKRPIGPLCEQLAAERVVHHAKQYAELATEMLERFVVTKRWSAIAAAKTVHRELEFLLAWPPGEANRDGRYLQGFLDCLYQDASGGWHLVDYKTNDVTVAEVPRVAQQYEMQMLLYALALERTLGQPPVELALHFLRPGIEHDFAWNDAARQRCIDLVNDAMNERSLSDA